MRHKTDQWKQPFMSTSRQNVIAGKEKKWFFNKAMPNHTLPRHQLEFLKTWSGECFNKPLMGNYVEEGSCQYSCNTCTKCVTKRSTGIYSMLFVKETYPHNNEVSIKWVACHNNNLVRQTYRFCYMVQYKNQIKLNFLTLTVFCYKVHMCMWDTVVHIKWSTI
jgi:hypothetical protein